MSLESTQEYSQARRPFMGKHFLFRGTRKLVLLFALGCFVFRADASGWTQYRGANGDGIAREKFPEENFAHAAKKLWTAATPDGFSSFAIGGGKAFTVVSRDVKGAPIAMCIALDVESGKEVWAAPTGVAMFPKGGDKGAEGNSGGDGPRSTPAYSDGKVLIYSADMILQCLNAANGQALWKKDVGREFGGRNIGWKSAMSAVIDDNRVYIAGGGPGESMLAFGLSTGEVIWKVGDEKMTHATPVIAELQGVRQAIFLMQSGLVAVDAANGKSLWKFPFPYSTATACSPVVCGDLVFCTAGYGVGGGACRVTKADGVFSAKEAWRMRGDNTAASLWSTPVYKEGYLYGMISYKKFGNGPLKCLDAKTGQVKWEKEGFGAGNVILSGNTLVALADDGEVVTVKAAPDGYHELSRMKAIAGKCWSTPAFSEGKLFVRSTTEGACLTW
jgi:outer membrane protein assembly factor BamB